MIEIGRLRLQLPAGFEHRGARISRLVADQLARHPIDVNLDIRHLASGPVSISSAQSDHQAAHRIAGAISKSINTRAVTGGES